MQRLAEVIFAQGLRGIRLSHVEDLPISIASAYDKPTAAVNDFFFFLCVIQLLVSCLYFLQHFKHTLFFPRFYRSGKSAVTDQRFPASSKTNTGYLRVLFHVLAHRSERSLPRKVTLKCDVPSATDQLSSVYCADLIKCATHRSYSVEYCIPQCTALDSTFRFQCDK